LCYEWKKIKTRQTHKNSLCSDIRPLALSIQHLAHKAKQQYEIEVDEVIREQSLNRKRIEHLLDGMLDFCFDDGMLALYKKLCRYYCSVSPDATVSYIYAYRDLWDTEQEGQGE